MTAAVPNTNLLRYHRSLLGPAWGMKLAHTLRPDSGLLGRGAENAPLRDAVQYRALRAEGLDAEALRRYPLIAAAEALNAHPEQVEPLQLMVVVDLSPAEICQRSSLEQDVLDCWEQLFFDVRDLRRAHDWLSNHLISQERKQGNGRHAARLTLALMAGPKAVRAMLDTDSDQPIDEAERLFQRHLKLHVKFEEAANLPLVTERDYWRFPKLYLSLTQAEQRLEFARAQLEQRSLERRERHEHARLRLELLRAKAGGAQPRQHDPATSRPGAPPSTEEVKLEEYRALAEGKALSARMAASPLSNLTWGDSIAGVRSATENRADVSGSDDATHGADAAPRTRETTLIHLFALATTDSETPPAVVEPIVVEPKVVEPLEEQADSRPPVETWDAQELALSA